MKDVEMSNLSKENEGKAERLNQMKRRLNMSFDSSNPENMDKSIKMKSFEKINTKMKINEAEK